MSRYSTSEEFLKYTQERLARPVVPGGGVAPGFEAATRSQLSELGHNPDNVIGATSGSSLALAKIREEVFQGVQETVRDRIQVVAIGVLDAGSINARILRSPEGLYALVLHGGLMVLLHKFFKYIVGWQQPGAVIYCNRKNPADLSINDLREYMFDVVENSRKLRAPYGAMIRLSTEATLHQSALLHLAELFVLCHELGHFLNGDLDDKSKFQSFEGHDWLYEYVGNVEHEREYGADETGFELMCDVIGGDHIELLPPVIALFNLFYLLGGRDSRTHPHPLERGVRIVERFFGKTPAEALRRSYDDPRHLVALLR